MPDHKRDCRPLLLGEREELRRQFARQIAIERYKARNPEAVQDREQQERIFGGLFESFSFFDQQTRPSAAALVSGAAKPLTWPSGFMRAT